MYEASKLLRTVIRESGGKGFRLPCYMILRLYSGYAVERLLSANLDARF